MFNRKAILWSLTLSLIAGAAMAGEWGNWRGPTYNGAADEKGLLTKFSPTEGVLWSADMPGPSAATPAVWGDNVFVTVAQMEKGELLALCLDRKTGKLKWQQSLGTGYRAADQGNAVQLDDRSNYASPSPVTDGKRVFWFFGNGDLVATDTAGKKLWQRQIQKEFGDFAFNWTFSTSPQLWEGKLYMQVLQRDIPVGGRGKQGSQSFLLAMDPATGKDLWKVERPSPAKFESREAFTTPIPFVHNGRKELLVVGGNVLTGHDPATGKELWRWNTYTPDPNHASLRLVPSPVAGGGVILACGPKREPVFAIKVGLNGETSADGLAWKSEHRSPVTTDVPTPAFANGKFYVVSDLRKAISCVNPADGKILWTTELAGPAPCWSSPTVADGKVYCMSLRGDIYVVDANTGALLSTNAMAPGENEIRSSIAAARGALFIRTNSKLYCVGK